MEGRRRRVRRRLSVINVINVAFDRFCLLQLVLRLSSHDTLR
jgi:hypothetical protein